MNASEYQSLAARTLTVNPGFSLDGNELMIVWNAVGISGEAGEILEMVKKGIFHSHDIDLHKLEKEIGDILWYIAALCTVMGLDMSQVMETNIAKLKIRYPSGFSFEDSKKRSDT